MASLTQLTLFGDDIAMPATRPGREFVPAAQAGFDPRAQRPYPGFVKVAIWLSAPALLWAGIAFLAASLKVFG